MNKDFQSLIDKVDFTKPMFKARSSEVFDLGDEKVLKLYFPEIDEKNVNIEYVNTCVAFSKGCTPMECYGKVMVNGRYGLVLKKLYGCSLTALPEKNPVALFTGGKIIANLHTMVHSQTSHELRDVRAVASETLDNGLFGFLSADEMTKIKNYVAGLPEADNIIHLDFHTDNIMCDGKNNQVIDWMTACRGKPECELAMMSFLFHDAELFPGSSPLKIAFLNAVRVYIYNCFIKNYCKMNSGITADSHKPWDIVAWVLRMGIWNIKSEKDFLQGKIKEFANGIKL